MTPIVVNEAIGGLTQLILDPIEVATARSELDISSWVAAAGIDWGDGEIQAYMAEHERGETAVDFRIPNRVITIPLILKDTADGDYFQATSEIQAKAALFQSEGGWLKRVTAGGGTVYADIQKATWKLPDSWLGTHREVEPDAQLILDCTPDFYGNENELATNLVTNPSFEVNTADWNFYSPGAEATESFFDRDGAWAFVGDYSLRFLAAGSPDCSAADTEDGGVRSLTGSSGMPVAPGQSVYARLAYHVTHGLAGLGEGWGLRMFWYQADGTSSAINGSDTSAMAFPTTLTDQVIEATFVAPSDAAFCALNFFGRADEPNDNFGAYVDAVLVGPTSPYFDGDSPNARWTGTAHASTSQLMDGIKGDYPGRVRIVVDEDDAEDQLGLVWGIRSRHYSSASTAALAYEAEALTPLDAATLAALSGASGSGSNTVYHVSLSSNWTAVLGTNLAAGTFLTHKGTYRVMARVYSASGDDVKLRFVWDVGDLTLPVENASFTFPGASNFYIADLGEIRLDPAPSGAHRWEGQIQAKGSAGGESVRIDKLWLVPVDEGFGKLTAPVTLTDGLTTLSARDEFNQSAGALTGKTAPVGGNWAGAGDANDYAVVESGAGLLTGQLQRVATGDADLNTGRYGVSGVAALGSQVVQIDLMWSATPSAGFSLYQGVLARYVDASNWLMAHIEVLGNTGNLIVRKRVGGTVTTLATLSQRLSRSSWYSIRLVVDVHGRWHCWFWPQGGVPGEAKLVGVDSALATGGALDDGKPGIYDASTAPSALTRSFDNFAAWVPPRDAVLFASQSAELSTEGMYREDSAGAAYGPVSRVIGSLPRIPPSGLEARTVEFFLKASRGDLDRLPDSGIDDISAKVYYRPSWLQAPG